MKNLKDIPIQNELYANKMTYLDIQSGNKNLGGENNTAYLIPPTQLQIASYSFQASVGNNIKIMMTNKLTEIDSCTFTLYNSKYDEQDKIWKPFEPVELLGGTDSGGQKVYLDQSNNVLELVNFMGCFCMVKDFSQTPLGLVIMYGSNNPEPITNIMQQGLRNKWES